MKFNSDIDIDFGDRSQILSIVQHVPASIKRENALIKHNTGVYVTDIPVDPFNNFASIDYQTAEERGYIKLDFLNVHVYNLIKNEQHLIELMNRPPQWDKLYDENFCKELIHIGNHYETLIAMPEAVNTILRMAMFLSVIRPAKRNLVGKSWQEVGETVWERPTDGTYYFKKSHAIAYAHLVIVHMNLLGNLSN